MVEPNIYRATATRLDPTGQNWSAPKLNELADVVEGKHPGGQRIQAAVIEGLNPMFGYKALVRRDGSTYYAYRETGVPLSPSSSANAHEVIQAAINYVSSAGGGKVFIKDGAYTINAKWTIPSSVEVWGESRLNTILKSASTLTATPQLTNTDTANGDSYITLANITIDHSDVPTDTGTNMVAFTKVSNSLLFNAYLKNGSTTTLLWTANGALEQRDNFVVNNIIENTRSPKPTVGSMANLNDFSDSIVTGNIFKGAGGSTATASGALRATTVRRCLFANNVAYNSAVSGLSFTPATECIISNNVVHDCAVDGIKTTSFTTSFRNIIHQNRCELNTGRGLLIQGDDMIISSNYAAENQDAGIELDGADRAVVTGNVARNNGKNTGLTPNDKRSGIRLVLSLDSVVQGNKCYDDQGTKTQLYGIAEAGAVAADSSNQIVNNQVLGNVTAGVWWVGTNTTVKNNHGYNPQGVATISVGGSPFAYTNNDRVPEAVYISNGTGTVSAVRRGVGGTTVSSAAPCTVWLEPLDVVEVVYSGGSITMVKDRK